MEIFTEWKLIGTLRLSFQISPWVKLPEKYYVDYFGYRICNEFSIEFGFGWLVLSNKHSIAPTTRELHHPHSE